MKIGFFGINGWEGEMINNSLSKDDIFISKEVLDESNVPEKTDLQIISVFINSKITKRVLSNFPDLKFITTRSTGFDHIDLDACKEKGISVSYLLKSPFGLLIVSHIKKEERPASGKALHSFSVKFFGAFFLFPGRGAAAQRSKQNQSA